MPAGEPPSVVTGASRVTARPDAVAVSSVVEVTRTVTSAVGDVEAACEVLPGTNVAV